MKPDQTHPTPDQQDTLLMDLSPIGRTFFGAQNVGDTKKPAFNPFMPNPNDGSTVNGTTRRLDSFAEEPVEPPKPPDEPVGPTTVEVEVPPIPPRTPDPKDSEELTSGEVTPRRDLSSVFDKEVWGDQSQFRIC